MRVLLSIQTDDIFVEQFLSLSSLLRSVVVVVAIESLATVWLRLSESFSLYLSLSFSLIHFASPAMNVQR